MTLLSAFGIVFIMIDPFSVAYYDTENKTCNVFEKENDLPYVRISEADLTPEQKLHVALCADEQNLRYQKFTLDKHQ